MKMIFISMNGKGSARLVALDESGILTTWVMIEHSAGDLAGN